MRISNPFFKKKNSIFLIDICKILKIKKFNSSVKVNNISDLKSANKNDISFFNSLKYINILKSTKSKYVITNKKYEKVVGKFSKPLIVENVLKSVALVTQLFYPDSLNDSMDTSLDSPVKTNYPKVLFGKNILLGKNVLIGKNSLIGHNTIIESNVMMGSNCVIGNNVIIKNSLIGNNVRILDGAIIGKKGFGFFPSQNKNFRYPHIGMVIINDNVEIGCNNTIDRGSLSDTIIGNNTFIDNQVHIAHNVNIGKNCIITAQVGFAGSSIIGNKVSIGGQAGVSGHLKIGNNVQIGGGSGVIRNIPDNTKVMGYPAKDIRKFLKDNK